MQDRVHDALPFSCAPCSARFLRQETWEAHVREYHGTNPPKRRYAVRFVRRGRLRKRESGEA
jgi:hypothetical protein